MSILLLLVILLFLALVWQRQATDGMADRPNLVAREPQVVTTIPDQTSPDAPDQGAGPARLTAPQRAAIDPAPGNQPDPTAPAQPPEFDLVRVDRDGSAVVAGRATPGSTVKVIVGGVEVAQAEVSPEGTFVAIMDLPTLDSPGQLNLVQRSVDGTETSSNSSVLVMPRPELPPQVVVAGNDGAKVIQGGHVAIEPGAAPVSADQSAPSVLLDLSLDTIAYDEAGDVILGGRGSDDQFVRVYVNNREVETKRIADGGEWKVVLTNVEEGLYTLRVDSIDESGEVTARVESPFKRETPELSELGATVTIQPGFTLWYLAERKYGQGDMYVQIYQANRDSIRNPDLIYPGQVFDLPE